MSFPDEEIHIIIRWWENDLNVEERNILMGKYRWQGSTEERHKKLREMHSQGMQREME